MATNDAERVASAIRYLDEHYREQPSLDDVANAIGLSPFHFQRLFKRWAGVSPKRFLQFLTIEHAKAALVEGRSTLEASWDSGLSGSGRLHDLFVSVEAVTPGEFKADGAGLTIRYGHADSPFGEAFIGLTDRGVCALSFPDSPGGSNALGKLRDRWRGASIRQDKRAVRDIAERLFSGTDAEQFYLELKGTNFQLKVWEALLRIPSGTVVSYGDVARSIGNPAAFRAVGTAVGQNPVSYLIPCHRVIKSTGAFGNYGGGLVRKKVILGWEAAKREAATAA
jgi:AraC family transcriptional regulator of adaptative response/methylated-DNA-[protein]-cysteine methyltransferase